MEYPDKVWAEEQMKVMESGGTIKVPNGEVYLDNGNLIFKKLNNKEEIVNDQESQDAKNNMSANAVDDINLTRGLKKLDRCTKKELINIIDDGTRIRKEFGNIIRDLKTENSLLKSQRYQSKMIDLMTINQQGERIVKLEGALKSALSIGSILV